MIEKDVAQFASDKIINKAHIGRVASWVGGKNVAPITVEIDMTNACNNKCPGCAGGRVSKSRLERPVDVIDQLSRLGAKAVIFTGGGEPLVDKRTPGMISYAHARGLDVGLITNGNIMTPDLADQIVKACTWVRVSLDAATPEGYYLTHGMPEGAFYNALGAIWLLKEAKKEAQSKCTVGVGYLTDERTLEYMEDATIVSEAMGADYIQFRPFHGSQVDIEAQLEDCLYHETAEFKVLWSKHKYDSMKRGDFGRNYGRCFGQQFATVVGADNKMYVCCHMRGNEKYVIGDLTKQSVRDIWESQKRQEVIKSIDFADCPPLCRDNTFNQILWAIKQGKEHVNFL